MARFVSTKTYRQLGPVAYRQWRADSHCNLIHGYALTFHFEFECDTLDARNWCVDFGGLRELKYKLEDWFDHTLLVAQDDPEREEKHRHGYRKDERECADKRALERAGALAHPPRRLHAKALRCIASDGEDAEAALVHELAHASHFSRMARAIGPGAPLPT